MILEPPLVSVILTTRDRPSFLRMALACFRHQTYRQRELIVVDDGEIHPADPAAVAEEGGRLIRMPPDTPLGTKLNQGVEAARGALCQKMDDDDWYAPAFLETLVGAIQGGRSSVCTPQVACLMPFLFFEVARWEVRRSLDNNIPGATLVFAREDGLACPFRPLPADEDIWFVLDQTRSGASLLPVNAPELFLAVRHRGAEHDRGHTWTRQWDGRTLEAYVRERPLYPGGPEALLPPWALSFYDELRRDLPGAAPVS